MEKLSLIIEKSFESFDKETQDLILIEEMSELTKALLKYRRNSNNMESIKEEFSHVLISLGVVGKILGISEEDIEAEAEKKLDKYGWL